jgi:small subunit ribosomal protein S1
MAEENKLILSEKAKGEKMMREMLKDYKKGDIIEGTITGIADFGAFIRFGSKRGASEVQKAEGVIVEGEETVGKPANEIEGLIHISELDWQLVQNPAEVVKVGETVKAEIIDINNNQVFLSLKRLKENPWQELEKNYKKGDIIKGKVVSFSPFGAFVEVMPKIRGLCHISEFAGQKEMEEALKVGQEYDFEILQLEPREHRMSLKLTAKK